MRTILLTSVLMACRNENDKTEGVENVAPVVVDADGDGYSVEDGDCDDTDAQLNPSALEVCDGFDNNCDGDIDEDVTQTFYADSDSDGFGDPENTLQACDIVEGYAVNGSDCDDQDGSVYPSAEELCDGLDNDCDQDVDEDVGSVFFIDADGDGVGDSDQMVTQCDPDLGLASVGGDCDDSDPMRTPNAFEICDDIDNDCDEDVDEGVKTTFYMDADEDGFGDINHSVESCTQEQGYATNSDDCNDIDPLINPLADEICDEEDNDCDGFNNEVGSIGALVWYLDGDGDGYGDVAHTMVMCDQPLGYVSNYDDCDDANIQTSPNAFEVCDGIDNNCDGQADESGSTGEQTFYADLDGDGFGDPTNTQQACSQPSYFTTNSDDCNDANATVHLGASEVCDNLDNNCDGDVDIGATDAVPYFLDLDGDGYGGLAYADCTPPTNAMYVGGDCNDSDPVQNLDDADGDGFTSCDNDCDDFDASKNPTVMWYVDNDGDGFGDPTDCNLCEPANASDVLDSSDCNDADASENPTVTWYADGDGDGFGDAGSSVTCARASSTDVIDNTDCDDADSDEYPGVVWYGDLDGDGYGLTQSGTCSRVLNSDVLNSLDCDDGNAFLTPEDADGDGLSTCLGDCDDGDSDLNQNDSDGDGYSTCDGDCNDASTTESPVGVEDCSDGVDNDCDGQIDNGPVGTLLCEASSCSDVGTTGLTYIDHGLGNGPDWYYCENDTDGGGWTLAYWNSYGHHSSTSATNRSSLGDLNTHAKLADSEISGIAMAGFGEVMVKDHHTTTIYIERYTMSAWTYFSSRAWENQTFESMDPNGNWVSGCNGHYNNRGISTFSDNAGGACQTVYQGSPKYFVTWHIFNYSNGVGGEYGVYVR